MVLCPTYSVPEALQRMQPASSYYFFFFFSLQNKSLSLYFLGGREGGQERFSSDSREKGLYF